MGGGIIENDVKAVKKYKKNMEREIRENAER